MKQEQKFYAEENNDYWTDDDNIYSEKVRDQLLDDDELSAGEEGFMVGYLDF